MMSERYQKQLQTERDTHATQSNATGVLRLTTAIGTPPKCASKPCVRSRKFAVKKGGSIIGKSSRPFHFAKTGLKK